MNLIKVTEEIPYIDAIPDNWKLVPNRYLFFENGYKVGNKANEFQLLSLTTSGVKIKDINDCGGKVPTSYDTYQTVKKGQMVFCLFDLDCSAVFSGISNFNGMITSAYCVVSSTKLLSNNYADYWFRYVFSNRYYMMFSKNIRYSITGDIFRRLKTPVPEFFDQQLIANFLDDKCEKIDRLIALQEKMIEELKAYKQSVITEAVTKGLDPSVPMKDSGIEWNKSIPSHWNVVYPKVLFSQRKNRATSNDRQLTASQQYGIIYQDEFMQTANQKVVTVEKDFDILKKVEPNDFVISMRSFQGGLEYSTLSGSISSAYVMLIPNFKVYPPFFRWLFKSTKYINALQSTSNLVRDGQAMRFANFVQVYLFELPIEEQKLIAEYLNEKCKLIDELIEKKELKINELKEYKKSLIYEYVTGKKEVV